jgi:hypothetical protein
MSETQGWQFRLAGPDDAEAFTRWTLSNPLIDPRDIEAGKKKNNPTVVYFAVENSDGVVMGFTPVYLQMTLAHLVLNPDVSSEEIKRTLKMGLDGVVAFAASYGIHELTMLSRAEYPVAKWAMRQGFELDPRQFFKLDIGKSLGYDRVEGSNGVCLPTHESSER